MRQKRPELDAGLKIGEYMPNSLANLSRSSIDPPKTGPNPPASATILLLARHNRDNANDPVGRIQPQSQLPPRLAAEIMHKIQAAILDLRQFSVPDGLILQVLSFLEVKFRDDRPLHHHHLVQGHRTKGPLHFHGINGQQIRI